MNKAAFVHKAAAHCEENEDAHVLFEDLWPTANFACVRSNFVARSAFLGIA